MLDAGRREIESVHIGNAPGAIHDAVGRDVDVCRRARMHAEAVAPPVDSLDFDLGLYLDSDTLAFGPDVLNSVCAHGRQQSWQHFRDRDLGAGARINMPKLQRDDASVDENHLAWQIALA